MQRFAMCGVVVVMLAACGGPSASSDAGTVGSAQGGGVGVGGGAAGGGAAGGGGGSLCVPKTCDQLGKNCGEVLDGCGGQLQCGDADGGECSASTTCGGGGTPNVCGARCLLGCPNGFACDLHEGACVPGDLTDLQLDVKAAVRFTGTLTVNGATPTSTCTTGSRATLKLVEKGGTRTYLPTIACGTAMGAFDFDTAVYPGRYAVSVMSTTSPQLPTTYLPLTPSEVDLTAETLNLALDLKTIDIGGVVTSNGGAPTQTCTVSSPASVLFTDITTQGVTTVAVPCSTTSPFAFTGKLVPGTYKVEVRGNSLSNLPTVSSLIDPAMVLTSSNTALGLDVRTLRVGGTVTLNGQQPTTTCSLSSKGTVRLTENTTKAVFNIPIPCNMAMGPFSFEGGVFAGTYTVAVLGSYTSNLPGQAVVIDPALVVNADVMGLQLDVKAFTVGGSITLNGATPSTSCTTPTTTIATVTFTNLATQAITSAYATCAAPQFVFTAQLGQGTYSVKVRGGYNNTSLPTSSMLVNPSLTVSADAPNLMFDVKTLHYAGTVTANSQAVTTTSTTCSATNPPGYVDLTETTTGVTFALPLTCPSAGAASFDGLVSPGTYKVGVRGTSASNLVTRSFIVKTAQMISADTTAQMLDQRTVKAEGLITFNRMLPVLAAACTGTTTIATLTFTDTSVVTLPNVFSVTVPCANATTFHFGGAVFPGTYRVDVRGSYSATSNLPTTSQVLRRSLDLTADQLALTLDLSQLDLGGTVTLGGAQPTSTCTGTTSTRATVRFLDLDSNVSTSLTVPCNGATTPFTFAGKLTPGSYRVFVAGGFTSNISTTSVAVVDRLRVPAAP